MQTGKSDTGHKHAAGDITSGTLGIARGGTGVTANPSMLINLASTTAASVFATSPRPGVTGTLPVANGGTGATTAANARSNLGITPANIGAAATSHTHAAGDITSGTFNIARIPVSTTQSTSTSTVPTSSLVNTMNTTIGGHETRITALENSGSGITYGTTDLTPGTSTLATGTLYCCYE